MWWTCTGVLLCTCMRRGATYGTFDPNRIDALIRVKYTQRQHGPKPDPPRITPDHPHPRRERHASPGATRGLGIDPRPGELEGAPMHQKGSTSLVDGLTMAQRDHGATPYPSSPAWSRSRSGEARKGREGGRADGGNITRGADQSVRGSVFGEGMSPGRGVEEVGAGCDPSEGWVWSSGGLGVVHRWWGGVAGC